MISVSLYAFSTVCCGRVLVLMCTCFGVNVHVSLLDAYSTHLSDQKFLGNFSRKNQMQRRYLENLYVFTPGGGGEGD
jgi:hypothetical protein